MVAQDLTNGAGELPTVPTFGHEEWGPPGVWTRPTWAPVSLVPESHPTRVVWSEERFEDQNDDGNKV